MRLQLVLHENRYQMIMLHIHYTRRLLVFRAGDHTSKKCKTSAMW